MGYMNEFPHSRMFDSDLREILELYLNLKELPNTWESYKKLMDENFIDLKNFVENYFKNIDIQNEVAIKLEDMKNSGELALIIAETMELPINIKMFGAIGDSVTDDTEAFKRAIAYGQEHKCPITINEGDYLITKTLTLDATKYKFIKFIGINPIKTVIRSDVEGLLFNLEFESALQFMTFENLTFIGNREVTHNCFLIKWNSYGYFDNCIFRNFLTAIEASYMWEGTFRRCKFYEPQEVSSYSTILLGAQTNALLFERCSLSGKKPTSTSYLMRIINGQAQINIDNCNFQYGGGIYINPNQGSAYNIAITNSYFEWMSDLCVAISTSSGNRVYGLEINNCYLNGAENNSLEYAIDIGNCNKATIKNCVASRVTNSIIVLSNSTCEQVTIDNCYSEDGAYITTSPHTTFIYVTEKPTSGNWREGTVAWCRTPTTTLMWVRIHDGTWKEINFS